MPGDQAGGIPPHPKRPRQTPDRPAGAFEEDVTTMEGQGVAASSASAVGRHGESGPGAVAAAVFGHPADNHATSDIADGGEGQGRNGDDSHVMVAPGHPGASAQDASMSQSPDSSQSPRPVREERSSQEPQAELSSQQIETDKADNIGNPDRNNNAVARDENTGHNQTAAGLAPPAVDAPAVNAPAVNAPAADGSPGDAASETRTTTAAGPVPSAAAPLSAASGPPETGEPETVQFPAVPAEPPSGPAPAAAQPAEPGPARGRGA